VKYRRRWKHKLSGAKSTGNGLNGYYIAQEVSFVAYPFDLLGKWVVLPK